MAATALVILRVTKFSPRRGDSWLNAIPQTANRPSVSRSLVTARCPSSLLSPYGLRGWYGEASSWGCVAGPKISPLEAW